MTFSLTLPDRIGQALTNKAAEYEQGVPEFLKNFLFAASHSKEGMTLKLELPPASVKHDPSRPELPMA